MFLQGFWNVPSHSKSAVSLYFTSCTKLRIHNIFASTIILCVKPAASKKKTRLLDLEKSLEKFKVRLKNINNKNVNRSSEFLYCEFDISIRPLYMIHR